MKKNIKYFTNDFKQFKDFIRECLIVSGIIFWIFIVIYSFNN